MQRGEGNRDVFCGEKRGVPDDQADRPANAPKLQKTSQSCGLEKSIDANIEFASFVDAGRSFQRSRKHAPSVRRLRADSKAHRKEVDSPKGEGYLKSVDCLNEHEDDKSEASFSESNSSRDDYTANAPSDSDLKRRISTNLVWSSDKIPSLTSFTLKGIQKYHKEAKYYQEVTKQLLSRDSFPQEVQEEIDLFWAIDAIHSRDGKLDWRDARAFKLADFCTWLRSTRDSYEALSEGGKNEGVSQLMYLIGYKKVFFYPLQPQKVSSQYPEFMEIFRKIEDLSHAQDKELGAVLLRNIKNPMGKDDEVIEHLRNEIRNGLNGHLSFQGVFKQLLKIASKLNHSYKALCMYVPQLPKPNTDKFNLFVNCGDSSTLEKKLEKKIKSPLIKKNIKKHKKNNKCSVCGHWHSSPCRQASVNADTIPDSNATEVTTSVESTAAKAKNTPKPSVKRAKGTSYQLSTTNTLQFLAMTTSNIDNLIPMTLITSQGSKGVHILLDSGATGNYLSAALSEEIPLIDVKPSRSEKLICSGFGDCKPSLGSTLVTLNYLDENNVSGTLQVNTNIITTDYDIILGRDTIRSNYLVFRFPSHFMDKKSAEKMLVMTENQTENSPHLLNYNIERAISTDSLKLVKPDTLLVLHELQQVKVNNATTPLKDAFSREDITEIPDNKLEALPTELLYNSASAIKIDEVLETKIFGSPQLQRRIRELLHKYKMCFSSHVSDTPAQVSPFELSINNEEWAKPCNRLPPRRFDKTRQYELRKQIDLLVSLKVIQPSTQPYYSHGFVVPKTDNKWRFVVDYKNLNKLTISENWPIPNIKEMIYRIGEHKPTLFAVMDLTSGYHQAPISEESRKWTAFMTPWGVYEWLRLPMGLKGAPSYFQRVMGNEVLGGLNMVICELYLDDIIVPGTSEDEFLDRLERVLQRFQERGITLNPSKCRFGLSEVTYVGHVINAQGIHFTRERLDSVMNFPKPKTQKHLKSFLGLANWFRNHVKNHSTIVKPLNEMLQNYNKSRRLVWTPEAESAFETIKSAIHECPMLFFMDDVSPVYLETDASDYGIGAYLYQVVDGCQHPIGFLSQAFNARMLNWHTAHKEGYAIFYALLKWEYLLRDRHFILRTDHRNLTQLKQQFGHAQKVQRWLTCFQGFDFTLEALPGKANSVADTLSRLCTGDVPAEEADRLCIMEDMSVPAKYWNKIAKAHNSIIGHHGVERTIQKLDSKKRDWTGRREHVRRFIRLCPCCQKMSLLKGPIHAHPFTLSSYNPMNRFQ